MGICVSCRRRARKAPEKRSPPGAGGPAKGAAAELLPRQDMANSMSNIKMTNPIKSIVSRHRKRYMKDGYNLDLAYITDRLIAMGFPAEKLEAVYRNHIDEVYRFLEQYHKDHYKIYNLCSERTYDTTKFHERVKRYAFDDHTPPTIEMIQPFCEDVHQWLGEDAKNVAAIHCKAGKGRTGTMVCCYLLYSRQKATADEALKFYGNKRTHDSKGVTIPSQRRYVEYYASLLHSGLQYSPTKIYIRELVMSPPPALHAANAVPELIITQADPFFKTPPGCHEVTRTDTSLRILLTHCTPLCGDVRVDVCKPKMKMRKEKLFHFWFNTFFVAAGLSAAPHPPPQDSPNLETFKLTLNKSQLDDAHKDKQHKQYSHDFKVELIVQVMPAHATFTGQGQAVPPSPSPPSSSASDCSEPRADTDPQEWDSGEHPIPYTRLTADSVSDQDRPCVIDADTYGDNAEAGQLTHERQQSVACARKGLAEFEDEVNNEKDQVAYVRKSLPSHPDQQSGIAESDSNARQIIHHRDSQIDAFVQKGLANLDDQLVDVASYDKELELTYKKDLEDAFDPRQTPIDVKCQHTDRLPSTNTFDDSYKGNDEAMEYFCDGSDDVFSRESPTEESKKRDDKTKPRLSLGDMRASWREFSGKFASDSRKRKDDS